MDSFEEYKIFKKVEELTCNSKITKQALTTRSYHIYIYIYIYLYIYMYVCIYKLSIHGIFKTRFS